jgi:hypothetical protein
MESSPRKKLPGNNKVNLDTIRSDDDSMMGSTKYEVKTASQARAEVAKLVVDTLGK